MFVKLFFVPLAKARPINLLPQLVLVEQTDEIIVYLTCGKIENVDVLFSIIHILRI